MIDWLTTKRFKILLFVLFIISLFSALPILELRGEEPRRALVAIEMMLSDNFIVPTIHGENYLNKPPLFNWVLILFFKIFNSFDEWVVRIPSTLGFIFTGLLHFFVTKKYLNKSVALLSTLFFFTSGDILFYSSVHTGEIDLFYTFIVYAQIISLFVFYEQKKYFLMYLFSYLLMAVGFMTKGLPSLVFQGITLIAMAVFYKDFKLLFRWQHFLNVVLALLLIVLYFWSYNQFTDVGPFLVKLFNESSEKSAGAFDFFQILKTAVGFPFFLIAKLAPWSFLILVFLFKRKEARELPKNRFIQFSILFIATNILIYWMTPAIRIRYLFMFFPFLFLVLAYYVSPYIRNLSLKITKPLIIGLTIMLTIAICAAPFLRITSELTAVKIFAPFLILLLSGNILFFLKNSKEWVLAIAMILLILRIEMQLTYWPISHQLDFRHKELIDKALEISKDHKIYYTGKMRTFPNEISLGPVVIFKSKTDVKMPPYLNYRIPFYLAKNNFGSMTYHEEPQKGKYYLTEYDFYMEKGYENSEIIYHPENEKNDQDYVIFTIK